MNETSQPKDKELQEAKQMQHWVRRYAQNRSLPVLFNLAVFLLLWIGISLPSYWGGLAYRSGNTAVFAVCLVVLVFALLLTIYVSVPRWGGRRLQKVGEKLYANEGRVTIAAGTSKPRWWGVALAAAFLICVTGNVVLSVLGYLPDGKYQQPISAIYCVPFLVALNLLIWPATGYIPLLWPLLYAVHALLILAGATIVFAPPSDSLNMLIPIVGYGALTALISHLYSRWALHNVRTLVSHQLDRAEIVQDGDQF
jgi:hypothetical protein